MKMAESSPAAATSMLRRRISTYLWVSGVVILLRHPLPKVARTIAVVVSESAIVRIFEKGVMVGDIIPELWLLSRENVIANPRTPKGQNKSR